MSLLKRCLIFLMFVKELVQSSQCNQCYWTHTIQSGMMTWPICMLIIHNTNNTWCIYQSSHSCSYIITTCFSTTRISNSSPRLSWDTHSFIHKPCTINIESKYFAATFSMNTYKWEQMNSLAKENICWEVMIWKNGSGTLPICKRLLSDATDNHSRMMPVTLLIQSFCFKISSEDTLMIPKRNHWRLERIWLVCEQSWACIFKIKTKHSIQLNYLN